MRPFSSTCRPLTDCWSLSLLLLLLVVCLLAIILQLATVTYNETNKSLHWQRSVVIMDINKFCQLKSANCESSHASYCIITILSMMMIDQSFRGPRCFESHLYDARWLRKLFYSVPQCTLWRSHRPYIHQWQKNQSANQSFHWRLTIGIYWHLCSANSSLPEILSPLPPSLMLSSAAQSKHCILIVWSQILWSLINHRISIWRNALITNTD